MFELAVTWLGRNPHIYVSTQTSDTNVIIPSEAHPPPLLLTYPPQKGCKRCMHTKYYWPFLLNYFSDKKKGSCSAHPPPPPPLPNWVWSVHYTLLFNRCDLKIISVTIFQWHINSMTIRINYIIRKACRSNWGTHSNSHKGQLIDKLTKIRQQIVCDHLLLFCDTV